MRSYSEEIVRINRILTKVAIERDNLRHERDRLKLQISKLKQILSPTKPKRGGCG